VNLLSPTLSASFIEFANVTATEMVIGFIPGNGNKRLVVIKPTSPDNFFSPADNTIYNVGYTSNGSVVIMNGSGALATATGLLPDTRYYVKAFEFNEVNGITTYLRDCVLTGVQQTPGDTGSGARKNTSSSESTESKSQSKEFDVQVLGNPFEKKLSFKILSTKYNSVSVSLTDLSGKNLHDASVKTNSVIEIEKPMAEGIYLLKVNTATEYKVIRVVKIH
jgi:hypothetical protein